MRAVALVLATAAAFLPGIALAQNGALVFEVDGVRDDSGHVRVDVCTEDTFLRKNCPYSGAAPAVKGITTVRVENVPPGVYAAQVFHDHNDNGKVDRAKILGVPLEEVGFTNDAPVGLHGPRWSKAKVIHDSPEQTLSVTLRKYL
jgi:uncharacterized protein (DUF2141 family)